MFFRLIFHQAIEIFDAFDVYFSSGKSNIRHLIVTCEDMFLVTIDHGHVIEPFDLQFDFHLLLQITTVIG